LTKEEEKEKRANANLVKFLKSDLFKRRTDSQEANEEKKEDWEKDWENCGVKDEARKENDRTINWNKKLMVEIF
jgi:hypothetical protein